MGVQIRLMVEKFDPSTSEGLSGRSLAVFPLSRPHRPLGSGPWVPYEAICKRGVVLAAPTAAAECQGTLGMSLVPCLPLVVRCGAPECHYRRGLVGI